MCWAKGRRLRFRHANDKVAGVCLVADRDGLQLEMAAT
jgi:hypothetical protein